jgi:hypothetical protein
MSTMLTIQVRLLTVLAAGARSARRRASLTGDCGQTTAEYALVLIGAAALAFLLISWASQSGRIGKLFDFVLDQVTGRAG